MRVTAIVGVMMGTALGVGLGRSSLAEAAACGPNLARSHGAIYGNGGGGVVQRDPQEKILQAFVLDYWEHAVDGDGLAPDLGPPSLAVADKIELVLKRWERLDAGKAKLYRQWAATFDAEACYIPGIKLEPIDDAHNIGYPAGPGWAFEQVAVQVEPVLPTDHRYTIAKDIWDRFDNDSKAGLILHEIMYRDALRYGATTSVGVRYMNAAGAANVIAAWNVPQYVQTAALEGMGSAFVQGMWLDLTHGQPEFYGNAMLRAAYLVEGQNQQVASPWGSLDLHCAVNLTADGIPTAFSVGGQTRAAISVGAAKYRISAWSAPPCGYQNMEDFGPNAGVDNPADPAQGWTYFPTLDDLSITDDLYQLKVTGKLYFRDGMLARASSVTDKVDGHAPFVIINGTTCQLTEGVVGFDVTMHKLRSGTLQYCEVNTPFGTVAVQGLAVWELKDQFYLSEGTLVGDWVLKLNAQNSIVVKGGTGLTLGDNESATLAEKALLVTANGRQYTYGPGSHVVFSPDGYLLQ